MGRLNKTYEDLKQDFFLEMDFITNVGTKMFIYPFIGRNKLTICWYYISYGLIFITSSQLFITLILTKFSDWFEIINIAPNLGVTLLILKKYKKIHDNKELYDYIFKHFRFHIWDTISDSIDHKKILNQYTLTTRLIIRFEFYYTIGLAVVVDMFPRLIMLYETEILNKEKQYLYPFDGWYPFNKVQWYYAAYFWESFMTTVVIFIYVFVNMLHISYTRYICMEIKILGCRMENLITNDELEAINHSISIGKYYDYSNIQNKLKFIISKHQVLAKIVADLDEVLGDGMLLTYLFGSVFICLTAFTSTVVDDLYKSMRYFSFFCSLLVDTFFQCIMGQLLSNHSEKLENAIYFADWVHADAGTKKMLSIFLMRAQKPFGFSAKGYLAMNLDTFSGICSLSYQFFNLLRTAYTE